MAAASWDAVETSADVQGRIAQLWVYPVKSCAGVQVPAVRLDATGLAQDREWMVVDPQGVFLTQRSHPRMVLIQPELLDGGEVLALQAPGQVRHVVQPPAEAAAGRGVGRPRGRPRPGRCRGRVAECLPGHGLPSGAL